MSHNKRITEIIDKTAQGFGLHKRVMMGRSRFPEIVIPRHTAMYLAYEHGFSYSAIARRFNRTHGAIMHAVKSRMNDEQTNKKAAQEIQEIRKKINE
jgi:chromosomal replication initiator protein